MSQPDRSNCIALIHTVAGLIPVFEGLMAAELPDWARFCIYDDSLLKDTIRDGFLSPATTKRLQQYVNSAVVGGADAIVVTCSSLGTAVEATRLQCPVPLFRIDQGMAEEAVARGARIGVLATLNTTLAPTTALIKAVAARTGKTDRQITGRVCEGAFDLLQSGDVDGHDAAVAAALVKMAGEVDVIVLAQASMARAMERTAGEKINCPVLTSPELGVRFVRDALSS